MQMMKRKKLMPKTLMVLVSVVALGGLLLVNPGNTLLLTGGEAWATSLGARPGVGTSAGYGGGAAGAGAGARQGRAGGASLAWAPARATGRRGGRGRGRSRQGRRRDSSGHPKRLCTVKNSHPFCSQLRSSGYPNEV